MTQSMIMGFDYGTHRIGVAIGQRVTQTASPLAILRARQGQPNWSDVEALIKEWRPEAFVVTQMSQGLARRTQTENTIIPRAPRHPKEAKKTKHVNICIYMYLCTSPYIHMYIFTRYYIYIYNII